MHESSPEFRPRDRCSRREFLGTMTRAALGLGVCPFLTSMAYATGTTSNAASPAPRTGLVTDDRYLRHTLGKGHVESPERLLAITRRLTESGLNKLAVPIAPSVDPTPYLQTVHSEPHINRVAEQAHDISICRLAVSAGLTAVDAVCEGKVRNAFCAIRPPGHHATNTGEYGFCFFNNVAITARYAQKKHKLGRILIIDWDYHHGNGTEWAFYEDPTVLFFSTHALHAFPGTGASHKTGAGPGEGFNINAPLARGAGDKEILEAFTNKLVPAAEKFRPELVLISAGFDSRKEDLLGDFTVTDAGFAELTRLVMSIAEAHSRSRVVSLLEGGYNTEGLALAVESHLKTLMGAG